MPARIDVTPDSASMTLEEFVSEVEARGYDFCRQSDLVSTAALLRQLCNNKEFLLNRMLEELTDFDLFQNDNTYSPQVILLHKQKEYFLRANIWRPMAALERSLPGFRYDICHDHNFDILTVGYFGPGYVSRSYVYDDYTKVQGTLGEEVDLVSKGLFNLAEGTVVLYEAKKDVHVQLPPEELSISLNLIPTPAIIPEPQFEFDEESKRITRYLHSSGVELIVRLAACLGDESALDALDVISTKHPSSHVRALASVSQVKISPDRKESLTLELAAGSSQLINTYFRQELERYGTALNTLTALRDATEPPS